ncbi:MAG: hypothetical protein EPN56_13525 [Rhodanobacter sp.]|nr:MAG: hypothetical protein EPN78_09360 [Rhodanobacter sp.]TAM12027.1 MAG: hypothetical protein EPN66_07345 [Rhodanobacter sp.]TAM34632.1 MAG: hypothetical protein EPN56_13525 [Rhodanobacter sp.]
MAKLRLDEAPAAALPLRFLLSMPCWGILGGLLLLVDADAALRSRWQPATLAITHVWTLGVLGNAMFGSLLQFLPVAGSTSVRWGAGAPYLHAVFNLGVLALVFGLLAGSRTGLLTAGVLLPLAFLWLAAMTLPGLVVGAGDKLLRVGIGTAVTYGVLTAALGAGLVGALATGHGWWPSVVDVHASFGALGWIVLLIAAVARLTMPMFQGTRMVPARGQGTWLAAVALLLPLAGAWHALRGGAWLAGAVAAGALAFVATALVLQWPVARARRTLLYREWRFGLLALLAAIAALLAGRGVLAGVLAFGVGLPVMVGGMAMEIVPFVAWIDLRHRIPRGTRIPGVQRLSEDERKRRVLHAHYVAAPLLVLAACWPQPWLLRVAALAQVGVWSLHAATLWQVLRAARGFARTAMAGE